MYIRKNLIKSEENLELLCNKLNYLFEFLDRAYKINAGGCCYVASILAKLLEQDNIEYSVVVYGSEYDHFYDIDCSQYHYALRIKDFLVNYYEEDDDYMEYFDVCAKDLEEHYKECSWNNCYDRERNNYIKRIIKNFYKDFTRDLRE